MAVVHPPIVPFMRVAILCLIGSALIHAGEWIPISLETPQGSIAPACRWSGPQPAWSDGQLLIAVADEEATAVDATTGRTVWRTRLPDGRRLCALLIHDHHLLVNRQPVRVQTGQERTWDFNGCGEVLRLDARTGVWAEPVTGITHSADRMLVSAVVPSGEKLFVARHRWEVDASGNATPAELDITAVDEQQRGLWQKRWPCHPPHAGPGAFLLTGPQPTSVREKVFPCLAWGDDLVVCPGPTSPISVVDARTGADRWSIERLWEFDRDFIGPSVWCHTMRRFGRDERHEAFLRAGTKTINATPEDAALVDAQIPLVVAEWRQAFDQQHLAWIAGGPWRVQRPLDHGQRQADAILIAMAIAPRHGFARNLARVRLYDIGSHGDVVALTDLPRPIHQAEAIGGLLVFSSLPRGSGAIRPFPHDTPQIGMGGGPDCLLSMAWYEESEEGPVDAWLQGQWTPPATVGCRFIVSPHDGGVVQSDGDAVLVAGLDIASPVDGTRWRCSLRIGLGGPVAMPTVNFRKFLRPNRSLGTISYAGMGSDAPTAYRILDHWLVATLGRSTQVVFPLAFP